MGFIGVQVEEETSAPPPKKNPGSAPDFAALSTLLISLNEIAKKRCVFLYSPPTPIRPFFPQSFFAFKIKDGDCRKILKILDNSFMSPRD